MSRRLERTPLDLKGRVEAARRDLDEICRRFEVEFLALFGSYARGELHDRSDIDLAVDFGRDVDTEVELDFWNQISDALSTDRVDIVNVRRGEPLVLRDIGVDGVALYEAEPGVLAEAQVVCLARYLDTAPLRHLRRELLRER